MGSSSLTKDWTQAPCPGSTVLPTWPLGLLESKIISSESLYPQHLILCLNIVGVGVCVCVWVAQSCLTLCDPMDCSLLGSSVRAIILEWVAIPFSRGSSPPRGRTQISCITGRFFTIWAIPGKAWIYRSSKEIYWTEVCWCPWAVRALQLTPLLTDVPFLSRNPSLLEWVPPWVCKFVHTR